MPILLPRGDALECAIGAVHPE
eukprot:SAG11_NODE_33626_length_276_cov_0.587571_1_plen_21_part_10